MLVKWCLLHEYVSVCGVQLMFLKVVNPLKETLYSFILTFTDSSSTLCRGLVITLETPSQICHHHSTQIWPVCCVAVTLPCFSPTWQDLLFYKKCEPVCVCALRRRLSLMSSAGFVLKFALLFWGHCRLLLLGCFFTWKFIVSARWQSWRRSPWTRWTCRRCAWTGPRWGRGVAACTPRSPTEPECPRSGHRERTAAGNALFARNHNCLHPKPATTKNSQ